MAILMQYFVARSAGGRIGFEKLNIQRWKENRSMIEYLEWLGECQGEEFTVRVRFTNLRQKNAIAEGT